MQLVQKQLLLVFAGKRASVFHKSIPPFPKKHVPFPGKSRELFNKTIRLFFGGDLEGLWTVSYVVKHMFFVAFYSKASYVCNKTKKTKLIMGNLTPSTYEQALAYLTINSSFTGDLGLFHGRMGIILFFAHYARATQSKHYEDFAGCLLDELYEEVHEDLPIFNCT